MRIKIYLLCPILSAILYSCQASRESVINISDNANTLSQKEYFSFPQFVQLEDCGNATAIKRVDKVLFLKDRIVISDYSSNKLLLFDSTGKFLASTARMIGKGNNEYGHYVDCAVDTEHQLIYMSCDFPYQFLVFDANLKLQKCIKTNDYMSEITMDEEYLYAYCNKTNSDDVYELRCYDKNNLLGRYKVLLSLEQKVRGVKGMGYSLCGSDSNILFAMPFTDDVYEIRNGEVYNIIGVDFGEKWYSYNNNKHLSGRNFVMKNKDVNWIIQNMVSTDSLLFFNTNKAAFYKVDKIMRSGDSYKYFDDTYFPYSSSWMTPCYGKSECIVQVIPAEGVREYVKMCKLKNTDMLPAFENFNVSETANNPVLQILKLK